MEIFEIEGGKKLSGTIEVRGSKNAATPILAACLLTQDLCVIRNVPRIEDVFRMLEIIKSLGARVTWKEERTLEIQADQLALGGLDTQAVKRIRSSILLLAPLAARFKRFSLPEPGGCVIGARPVDTHLAAFEQLGVTVQVTDDGYSVDATKAQAGYVVLRELSVTATENALMLAATLPDTTTIKIAACEPHVEDLCRFLVQMGAQIRGIGTHTLTVQGSATLSGAEHTLIPDHNEAATFLILGAATGSRITVQGARRDHLDLVLEKLQEFGVRFEYGEGDQITVIAPETLHAVQKIEARTYPGLPTDIQAPLGVLATQAEGQTFIFDTLFEGRFSYVAELEKMGGKATVLNPHQVIVYGKTALKGTVIKSYDLRAGVALIIAALAARGTTVVEDIYQVDRGYEALEERLALLGASIRRIDR
ncbi:MAG: UDP-N-acetylglucosamine 1-carboxyvinyltransferase [Candidatus Moraniibacteriota bacterium]